VTKDHWVGVEAANPPQPRSGHSLAIVDGCCYIFGGQDYASGSLLDDMQMLDLREANPVWRVISPAAGSSAPCARSSHCCVAINENIYVFGGSNSEGGLMNDMHVFNTNSKVWTSVENSQQAPQPREMASSVAVGDRIYIIGGRGDTGPQGTIGVLDANLNQWTQQNIPPLAEGRMAHGAAALGSSIFIFGGATLGGISDELLCLDTINGAWEQVRSPNGSLPSARFAHTLSAVADGLVMVGGIDPAKDMNDAHLLEVTTLK